MLFIIWNNTNGQIYNMKIKTIILVILSFVTQKLIAQNQSSIYSWGDNSYGQLGLGFTGNIKKYPEELEIGLNWKSLLPLSFGCLGIKTDGTLWAWGNQEMGELGLGDLNPDNPTQIGTDNKWIAVYRGGYGGSSILGIKSNGTIWSWGRNYAGELGHGNNIKVNTPKQIGVDNNWANIYTIGASSFGIKSDGTLWAWGDNYYGQLGHGNNIFLNTPKQIGTDNQWFEIFGEGNSIFGIKTDGTLWAWGLNESGQLGLGNIIDQKTPKQIGIDKNWVNIQSLGYGAFCGIKKDGTISYWGTFYYNGGNSIIIKSPEQIGNDNNWKKITKGGLGIKLDGTLWSIPSETQIGADKDWSNIFYFNGSYFGIKSDGTLWAWGYNNYGQLGLGDTQDYTTPQKVGNKHDWKNLYAFDNCKSLLAIKLDGSVWNWGTDIVLMPRQVKNNSNWAKISAGRQYSLAIKENGTLWSWGLNDSGQLGLGDQQERNKPTQIGVDSNWISVSAGGKHVLALKQNGTLWTWGGNHLGQLGIGYKRDTIISNPIEIGSDTGWKMVSCGNKTSFAIKKDGTLWGWGYGNGFWGSSFYHRNPLQIGTDTDWKEVSAGLDWILFSAIKNDNSAWMSTFIWNQADWRKNHFTKPIQIGTDSDWLTTTAGESRIFALKKDGTLWNCTNDSLTSFNQIGSDKWNNIEANRTFCNGLKHNNSPCKISLNGNIEVLDSNMDWTAISSRSEFSSVSLSDKHSLGIRKIIKPTSGVESFKTSNTIYPVPTSGFISFLNKPIKDLSYEIYDLNGKRILLGKTQESIDVSTLSKGIYILKTIHGNFKFIKE